MLITMLLFKEQHVSKDFSRKEEQNFVAIKTSNWREQNPFPNSEVIKKWPVLIISCRFHFYFCFYLYHIYIYKYSFQML